MIRKIRFEQGLDKANCSRDASVEFVNCKVISIKAISGLTQYEDEAEFFLENKNVFQMPDFAAMHYLQMQAEVEVDENSFIRLQEKEDSVEINMAHISKQIKTHKVNEKFSVDIFEYQDSVTGTLTAEPNTVMAAEKCAIRLEYKPRNVIEKGGKIRILTPFSCWGEPCLDIENKFSYSSKTAKLTLTQKPYVVKNRGFVYEVTVEDGYMSLEDSFNIIHTDLRTRGIMAQPYMQNDVYFLCWEDCTGKGIFNNLLLEQCAKIHVLPGKACRFRLAVNQIQKTEDEIHIRIISLDKAYNPQLECQVNGQLEVIDQEKRQRYKCEVKIENGRANITIPALDHQGLYVIKLSAPGFKDEYISVYASKEALEKVYYGALHGHSEISDGTFSAEHYFDYGKQYAMLDFCALTDHDWEIVEHARNKGNNGLEKLIEICKDRNEDEKFVAIPAYEWMGRGGHMNVYFREDHLEDVFIGNVTLLKERKQYLTQKELVEMYQDREDVLVIPHLSHGFDWDYYHPGIQTAMEIYSQWGFSENGGAVNRKMDGMNEHLRSGKKLGLIGGADAHHGMAGQTGYMSKYSVLGYREGFAVVRAKELTRHAIFDGIKDRHVYATTGERILLDVNIDGTTSGDVIAKYDKDKVKINVIAGGTNKITAIKVYGYGGHLKDVYVDDFLFEGTIEVEREIQEHEYYYLKILQQDGEIAWSTPIWIEC